MANTPLLSKQKAISHVHPLPVDVTDEASRTTDVSGEAMAFIVASTNVADAGSAAGTVVYAKTTNTGILDSAKLRIGSLNDTSFSFGTGTVLTTQVDFDHDTWETQQYNTRAAKMAALGANLANGEFAVDHRTGLVIGKKAAVGTSDTVSYSYRSSISTSAAVALGSVTVTELIPGVAATDLGKAEDAAHTSGDTGVMALAVLKATPADTAGTDGDYEPLQMKDGRLWTSTTVTSTVPGTGATNLGKAEDAAHTDGDTGVMMLGVRQDTAAALAGTTGDYTPPSMDANNSLRVTEASPYSSDVSAALEASSVTKASAGIVYKLAGRIDSTGGSATYYVQLLNASSLPADGAVTFLTHPFKIAHTSGVDDFFEIDLGAAGLTASTGIVWCLSSTEFTKTISSALVSATVLYR